VIDAPPKSTMDELFRIGFDIDTSHDPELVSAAMTYGSACWPCFSTIAARATAFCNEHCVPFCFIGTQEGQNRLDLHGEPALAGRGLPRLGDLSVKFMKPFRQHALARGAASAQLLELTECATVLLPFFEFVKKPPLAAQLDAIKQAGWELPQNTGMCSTNCMVNELGRQVMRSRFGFDLYQVIDAHERRLGNEVGHAVKGKDDVRPDLDVQAVVRGARMMKLSREEREKFGIGED
jgi:hypothetical protein